MTETALRYLLEALNAGSMRAASDRLNIAPSSISRHIAQLENDFGLPLIEKGRRNIQLTQAGELVISYFRDQLASREALSSRLDDLRRVVRGKAVLAVGEGFLSDSFVAMLNSFHVANPGVETHLIIGSSQEIVRAVVEDEAHLGLVMQAPHDPKIQVRSSVAQPLTAVVSPSHPLAALESVSLAGLKDHAMCLPPPHFRLRQLLEQAEMRQNIFLEPAMVTGSIYVMRQMAIAGSAVAILPDLAVSFDCEQGRLVRIAIEDDALEHATVSLILRAGRQLEGGALRLLPLLEGQLRRWQASNPRAVADRSAAPA
ncbi:MAG: LysR family transcriptional regulator [Sphingobium sp.]